MTLAENLDEKGIIGFMHEIQSSNYTIKLVEE